MVFLFQALPVDIASHSCLVFLNMLFSTLGSTLQGQTQTDKCKGHVFIECLVWYSDRKIIFSDSESAVLDVILGQMKYFHHNNCRFAELPIHGVLLFDTSLGLTPLRCSAISSSEFIIQGKLLTLRIQYLPYWVIFSHKWLIQHYILNLT